MNSQCQKCGFAGQFGAEAFAGPRYQHDAANGRDYLLYICKRCGYQRREPTLDRKSSDAIVQALGT